MSEELNLKPSTPIKKPFVHLHVHTEYSLLDGAARILREKSSPLIQAALDAQMPAIAITDHGNMYGAFSFYNTCKKNKIKPIVGCELYTCENMHDRKTKENFHLVLLAKSERGYANIVKLDSLAFTEGFYYKPRIDMKLLAQHTQDVICLSACLGGVIPQFLLQNEYEKAKQAAISLRDMFAPGDFYIELQDHGLEEQKRTNPLLVKIAKEIGVKVVATNDVHYVEKNDAEMHDVLLCIQTGKTFDEPNRMRFEGSEFYLKDYDEMYEIFSWCPEALENTIEIAQKCDVKITKHELYPPYTPPDGTTPEQYLRGLAYDGLKLRYGTPLTQEIIDRAEYELEIIIKMGFAEYYLIVWDFINYAQNNDIPVGAGRGSGVGSIIAYAVNITNVDPVKYNLLFERFLNPERVSAPDFDIDFCFEGRGKVKEYVVDKYGKDKVCEIITFGTMATKAAIKDVARVYNVTYDIVNKMTKLIPFGKVSIEMALGRDKNPDNKKFFVPEFLHHYETDDTIKKVVDMAIKIEGMPRNSSKHAAGVVICKEVISDFIPLQKNGEDVTTQYNKDEVEQLGMLKMDFLGLKTLTDIKKTKQYVKETFGFDIDFNKLGYSDPEVYKLIGSGDTDAVFQLESPGMKKFMKELQPETLEDIIAGISLYRPGPMDSIPKYVESKRNPDKISYDHPSLEPILNMTYGCIVYQEQVMQIVRELGGYTYGRADVLRRVMSKKKKDDMIAERNIFINGCPAQGSSSEVEGAFKRGIPVDVATKIYDEMESFASYAFNKSHAAAYSVLAYETGYLKRYYPVHFITAVINNRITNADELAKYVNYLKECKYKVYPPDINKSQVFFSVEEGGCRFGLTGVKNVGEAAIAQAVEERKANGEYKSLYDFLKRTINFGLNKRLIESLIRGGAFDCFGETRATNMASYEGLLARLASDKKSGSAGQFSIFDMFSEGVVEDISLTKIKEYQKNEVLIEEKAVLNVYLTGHPMDEYRDVLKDAEFSLKNIAEILGEEESDDDTDTNKFQLRQQYDRTNVTLVCMIGEVRRKPTKSGQTMAMCNVEDLHGSIEIVLFPKAYESNKDKLDRDSIVTIKGVLNTLDRKPSIMVNYIMPYNTKEDKSVGDKARGEAMDSVAISSKSYEKNFEKPQSKWQSRQNDDKKPTTGKLYIKVDDEDLITNVCGILETRRGSIPAFLQINRTLHNSNIKVDGSKALLYDLYALLGAENVKLDTKK